MSRIVAQWPASLRTAVDLESLLANNAGQWNWRSVEYLVRELMRATIVDEGWIPADVVTMGTRVEYREAGKDSPQVLETVAGRGRRRGRTSGPRWG